MFVCLNPFKYKQSFMSSEKRKILKITYWHLANKSFEISVKFKYLWKTLKCKDLSTHIQTTASHNSKVLNLKSFISEGQAAEKWEISIKKTFLLPPIRITILPNKLSLFFWPQLNLRRSLVFCLHNKYKICSKAAEILQWNCHKKKIKNWE